MLNGTGAKDLFVIEKGAILFFGPPVVPQWSFARGVLTKIATYLHTPWLKIPALVKKSIQKVQNLHRMNLFLTATH